MSYPLIYTIGSKKIPKAKHFPVLKINYINENIDFNKYNLLIFTSQNAILSISKKKEHWTKKKILTIGNATKELAKKNGAIDITSSSKNNAISMIIENKELIKSHNTLYLRAKKISVDIKSILEKDNINIDEKIVYESICNINSLETIKKGSWIVISSPYILECFSKKFDLKDYKIMLFGKKIQNYMPKDIEYKISPKDTIKDTVDFILED